MRTSLGAWKSFWRCRRRHSVASFFVNSQHAAFLSTAVQGNVGKAREQQAENEAWAKTPGAREVLFQPPFDADGGGTALTKFDSLEDFLQVGVCLRC